MLAAVAFPTQAASVAYGEALDTLYRIDLDAKTATKVGEAGTYRGQSIVNISGLTTTSDGSLYAVAGGFKLLLRLNSQTGQADIVGSLDLPGGSGQFDALDLGMTADCDGTLWLASGTQQMLWKVDAQTAVLTLVGETGHAISGLVARDGALYGTGSQGDHTFYRLNTTTGAATAVGGFGDQVPDYLNSVSMGFDDSGTLWAVLNYVPPVVGDFVPDWADLATIDPSSGTVTVLGPITGPSSLKQLGMKGFTTGEGQCGRGSTTAVAAPVGSPAVLALLAALLAGVGLFGVRRSLRA